VSNSPAVRGRILAFGCVVAGSAALLAGAVRATPHFPDIGADLRASSEVPRPKGVSVKVGGSFTADYEKKTRTLTWKLTFWNLTGKATAAHIHVGLPGKAGPVLVPLCGPCKWGAQGTVKLTPAQAKTRQPWYVNVHTARNPGGEIRGRVEVRGPPQATPRGTGTSESHCCPPG
jgi:CHRD domain